MKINPITTNSRNFGASIKYNNSLQKGFDLALECANSSGQKNLDFSKTFIDNVNTILHSQSKDVVEVSSSPSLQTTEAYQCYEILKERALAYSQRPPKTELDSLKDTLEGLTELVEIVRNNYQEALKTYLHELNAQIKSTAK